MGCRETFTKDIDPKKNNGNPSRNDREIEGDYHEE